MLYIVSEIQCGMRCVHCVQAPSKDVEDVDRGRSTYGQLDSVIREGLSGKWRHEIRTATCRIRWPTPAGTRQSPIRDGKLAWQWLRRVATVTGIMPGAGVVTASFAKWKLRSRSGSMSGGTDTPNVGNGPTSYEALDVFVYNRSAYDNVWIHDILSTIILSCATVLQALSSRLLSII